MPSSRVGVSVSVALLISGACAKKDAAVVNDTDTTQLVVSGAEYESLLVAELLPDDRRNAPPTLAATDTSTINYQAEGWWMILGDRTPRQRSRFSANYERYTSGLAILSLDTLIEREKAQPPFDTSPADKVATRGLRELERVASKCRFGQHETDERILGIVGDTTPDVWMRPRVAWFVDTMTSRFRSMRPDALTCRLAPNPD
jgi:hypothetical protein